MRGADHNELWRAGLSRKLRPDEEAHWQGAVEQPEALAELEEELGLNRLLQELPDAPIASNFTAQVLQRAKREPRHQAPLLLSRWFGSLPMGWGRRFACASALLLMAFVSYQQYQLSARRELARSLVRISAVLPTQDVIQDFPAIEGLRQVSLTQTEEPDLLDALHER